MACALARGILATVVLLTGCGSSSAPSAPPAPSGPDAGAGCDAAIHGHCVYPSGNGEVAPDIGQVCVEYSGASPDHSACRAEDSLQPPGQYATGPCPRDQYDKSCILPDTPASDAGTCRAFETVWGHSSQWPGDAGLIGYPPCLNQ